jgi:hypothetical protein
MGTRVQHIVFDDLDHNTDGVGTYRFALEGIDYEIDLSEPHLGDLRAALAPYIAGGRRLPRTTTRRTTQTHTALTSRPGLRTWWADNADHHGLPAPRTHGKVTAAVITAYDNHH